MYSVVRYYDMLQSKKNESLNVLPVKSALEHPKSLNGIRSHAHVSIQPSEWKVTLEVEASARVTNIVRNILCVIAAIQGMTPRGSTYWLLFYMRGRTDRSGANSLRFSYD